MTGYGVASGVARVPTISNSDQAFVHSGGSASLSAGGVGALLPHLSAGAS